ncbi:MAG: prolipoprotein diacylglyceryl transferase, partial [Cyclobacteriaceae bacterium]|nr:prolipoprotein diacylglyceryl transferase [Cyclobacteriaceae bacterium]
MLSSFLSYIVWDASSSVIEGFDRLRWYSLLFALGFIISQQIMVYFFKKENKDAQLVDKLTIYMVLATIIGARLGHVLFYEPQKYLSNPLDILKIWEGGLASHGAAIA